MLNELDIVVWKYLLSWIYVASSVLMLLVEQQEGHLDCKKCAAALLQFP